LSGWKDDSPLLEDGFFRVRTALPFFMKMEIFRLPSLLSFFILKCFSKALPLKASLFFFIPPFSEVQFFLNFPHPTAKPCRIGFAPFLCFLFSITFGIPTFLLLIFRLLHFVPFLFLSGSRKFMHVTDNNLMKV